MNKFRMKIIESNSGKKIYYAQQYLGFFLGWIDLEPIYLFDNEKKFYYTIHRTEKDAIKTINYYKNLIEEKKLNKIKHITYKKL